MILPRRFWILLSLVSFGAIVALFLWQILLPEAQATTPFMFSCTAVFILINVFAYFSGVSAAKSTSRYRFIQLMMILIILKMFISLALVVGYVKVAEPESKLFVLPFLTLYLIYTVFEIFVLEKVARLQPERTESTDGR